MKNENKEKTLVKESDFLRGTALPFVVGLTGYLQAARFVPESWRFIPKSNGKGFVAGFTDGFGSIRNSAAMGVGLLAVWGTKRLLEGEQETKAIGANEDLPATNNVPSEGRKVGSLEHKGKLNLGRSSEPSR